MNKRKSIYAILILASFFYACESNRLDIHIEKTDLSIDYINADQLLYNLSLEEVKQNTKTLEEQLGDLFIYELSQNIRQNVGDSSYKSIYNFYNTEYISDLEKEKIKLYPELSKHENKINTAFQYLKHHFGDSILPKNIFYINKLFSQISCSQTNIAIGLESYISPNSSVIESLPSSELHSWQRDRMDINYLERDVLLSWIQVQLFNEIDGKLAEHIIQAGKILYVLNAAFPKVDAAYILRYTDEQFNWAKKNEVSVWNYLVEQQMLFKADMRSRTNF
ncbi:MAG TPA: hypothetical protein VKY37_10230, partial [Brumimicrobium sp.]|nr:hypothetical protein [Brumimicrobium sp.]